MKTIIFLFVLIACQFKLGFATHPVSVDSNGNVISDGFHEISTFIFVDGAKSYSDLDGKTFLSKEDLEIGLGKDGAVYGKWKISFTQKVWTWLYSDVQETGGYQILALDSLQISRPYTRTVYASYFGEKTELELNGKMYFLQTASLQTRGGATFPGKISVSPNPFHQATKIHFSFPTSTNPTLSIFNPQGHLISTLHSGTNTPGNYSATWDGKDNHGRKVPSGTYLVKLKAGDKTVIRKIALVR